MSTNIDTSDGTWRQITEREWADAAGDSLRVVNGNLTSWWLRVREVPALPTAPYTVIRVTSNSGVTFDCILHPDGGWWDIAGVAVRDVLKSVTPFEVLSEPRAVTAKAVLKALAATANEIRECDSVEVTGERWRAIARDFGVGS